MKAADLVWTGANTRRTGGIIDQKERSFTKADVRSARNIPGSAVTRSRTYQTLPEWRFSAG